MSTLYAKQLRAAITDCTKTAWGVEKIHFGSAMLPQDQVPYAVIRLASTSMDWVTVTDVEQAYEYEVFFVGRWSDAQVIEDEKVDRANELITELMSSTYFAEFGMMPRVDSVTWDESEDQDEPLYLVQVNFSVIVHVTGRTE